MRAFLEEAAGISRYKERRKETESRIAHTRENLERLNDLRDEVEKQLEHLQRQAATARRYQALKQDERQTHAELLALKLREVGNESGARQAILNERDLALQAAIAEQRSIEAAIERARQEHDAQGECCPKCRVAITRSARRSRAPSRRSTTRARCARASARSCEQIDRGCRSRPASRARSRAGRGIRRRRSRNWGRGSRPHARASAPRTRLAAAEHAMRELAGAAGSASTSRLRGASSRPEAERARLEVMENQLRRLVSAARPGDAGARQGSWPPTESQRLREVETRREATRAAPATPRAQRYGRTRRHAAVEARPRARTSAESVRRRAARRSRPKVTSCRSRRCSARRSGQGQGKVVDWLKSRGLDSNPRLAQQLTVDKGWDRAVETVLGGYLEAVCVDRSTTSPACSIA